MVRVVTHSDNIWAKQRICLGNILTSTVSKYISSSSSSLLPLSFSFSFSIPKILKAFAKLEALSVTVASSFGDYTVYVFEIIILRYGHNYAYLNVRTR